MVDDDLTHYEVLGVEPSADKEQIRAAYQERLDEIRADQAREQDAKKPNEAALSAARAREARLRSAWQVLSDPYQRGRYDATVELGVSNDGEAGGTDVEPDESEPALSPRELRARQRAEAMANRPPGMFSPAPSEKPPTWPAGVMPPPPRARTIALLIDAFVLFLIFFACSIAAIQYVENQYPNRIDRIERLDDQIVDAQDALDRAETRADRDGLSREERRAADREVNRLETRIDNLEEERTDTDRKIAGPRFAILGGGFLLLSLLYLVPSTLVSGRTLGKKLMSIRVVMVDGSPVRLGAALKRYGLPVVAAIALLGILGQLAFVVVLFGVLTWPRHPNLQGLHDRAAHTIVVDG